MLDGIRSIGLMVILGMAAVTDYRTFEIPDWFHGAAVLWWCVFLVLEPQLRWERFLDGMAGGILVAGGLLFLSQAMDRLLGKESLGGGDIKLFFVTGLYLGAAVNLLNLMLSCILGILLGLLRRTLLHASGDAIPFAPAIAVATGICLLAGRELINWYLSLF